MKSTKKLKVITHDISDIKVEVMVSAKELGRQYHVVKLKKLIDGLGLNELEPLLVYAEKRIKKEKKSNI